MAWYKEVLCANCSLHYWQPWYARVYAYLMNINPYYDCPSTFCRGGVAK